MEVLGAGCTGHEERIHQGKIVFCTGQMNDTGPDMQATASERQSVDSQS